MSVTPSRVLLVIFVLGVLGLVAVSTPVAAQEQVTFVDENVTENTTWTANEDPYRVVRNVTVTPETSLVIQNGTTVEVAEGVTISVAGTLRANGTAERPVRIVGSGADPVAGDWGSIRTVGSDTATVRLATVEISEATNAVAVSNPDSTVHFESVAAQDLSGDGIQVKTARGHTEISVVDSEFEAVGGAGLAAARTDILPVRSVSGWTVRGSSFEDSGGPGIDVHAERVTGLTVRDSTFDSIAGTAIDIDGETVRTTTISGNAVQDAPAGIVIETADASVLTVADNELRTENTGIDVHLEQNVYDLSVRSNRVSGGTEGISIDHDPRDNGFYSFDLAVTENNLSGQSQNGVDLRTSLFSDAEFAIQNNTVTEVGGNGLFLAVTELKNAAVTDNVLRETGRTGLFLTARHVRDALIGHNAVRDAGRSGIQISVRRVMERVAIRENELLDNAREGLAVRTGEATAGNYTLADNLVAANAYGIAMSGPQAANLTGNAIVFNTVSIGDRFERPDTATGIGVLVAEGGENVTLGGNDVYGNRIGLETRGEGTVTARNNYWGAESGPYHRSINPEGEGNAVVTQDGWATIVHSRTEPVNRQYARPEPAITASPRPAIPNQSVTISGADSSDPDGKVRTYQFTVDGETTRSEAPTRSVAFPESKTYSVTLWVEDDMGIESAQPATLSLDVTPAPTPTPTPTTEPEPTMTTTTTDEDGVGLFGWFGGLVGAVFYGVALIFGTRGMYETLTENPLSVRGRRIHVLAVAGILVWAVVSIPGPAVLGTVAAVGLVVWAGLTAAAYLLVRFR